MARRDWESVMGRTGEPVALDVTQTPLGGVAPKVVAAVAEPHAPGISRIEIYRYDAKDAPTPINVDRFLVLEDPTGRWDVGTIVVSASTEDNFNLRDYLRHYVFLVKEDAATIWFCQALWWTRSAAFAACLAVPAPVTLPPAERPVEPAPPAAEIPRPGQYL
jgi:hypothetical protein